MGLLDDAIREHLELKRSHGADPNEVARAEREALGPVVREQPQPPGEVAVQERPVAPEAPVESAAVEPAPAPEPPPVAPIEPAPGAGQETQAFDAEGIFDEEAVAEAAPPPAPTPDTSPPARGPGPAPAPSPDPEPKPPPPAPDPEPPPAPEPPPTEQQATTPSDPEDVLEDTPDFLQETPEHDRLWFEQKPPRDFDFDG